MPPNSRIANMFPFVEPARNSMQRDVVSVIQRPDFIFALPELSPASWSLITNNPAERERLEFLGDALIGAAISEELLRCWPNEGPGFYTMTRSVLTANSTFAHLMRKVGRHVIGDPVKPAGDTFETMLAAFHCEKGQAVFNEYVRKNFTPLLGCCTTSYHNSNRFSTRKNSVKKQMHIKQTHSTATITGNIKSRLSLKQRQPRKKTVRRDTIPEQFQVPTLSQRTPIEPRNMFMPNAKWLRESRVIDLTSDDEDPLVVSSTQGIKNTSPVLLSNKPSSSIMAGSSTLASNRATAMFLPPRPVRFPGMKVVTSHDILQSVRMDPKQQKTTGLFLEKREAETPRIPGSSQTSANLGQLGSMSNPITLD